MVTAVKEEALLHSILWKDYNAVIILKGFHKAQLLG